MMKNSHKGTRHHPPSYLPVLRDSIPHSNFPCVARGHQLVPNKEEVIHRHTQAEYTCVGEHMLVVTQPLDAVHCKTVLQHLF